MEAINAVGILILFYIFIYFLDRYLKRKNSVRYARFLKAFPIEIEFMNVKWATSMFNKTLNTWAIRKFTFLYKWYNVGAAVTLMLCIPSMILLASTAVVSFENLRQNKKEEAALQPVLPGVNLPKSDILYYFITLLVCTVVHEIGHAMAAISEQVPLQSIGFVIWLIIPAAFVELPTSNVIALSPWKQLKIYCAGVWHNVVLSFLAFLALILMPYMLMPLFQMGSGVYVIDLNEYLTEGYHDFQIGDQITHTNDCRITDSGSWNRCLASILHEPPSGFCVDRSYLSGIPSGDETVCCHDSELSQSHLCFISMSKLISTNYYCLRAREVSNLSSGWCLNHGSCLANQSCLIPAFKNETESSKLILVKRRVADPILFVGQPDEIYSSVHVSDYIPRTFLGPRIIHSIDHLLRYIVSFSAGLAVLNVVPCVFMDGQHIASAFNAITMGGLDNIFVKRHILRLFVFLGTSLIVVNIACGMLVLLF